MIPAITQSTLSQKTSTKIHTMEQKHQFQAIDRNHLYPLKTPFESLNRLLQPKILNKMLESLVPRLKQVINPFEQKIVKKIQPLLRQHSIPHTGSVNAVTGAVNNNQTDFELNWRIHLVWNRIYDSSDQRVGYCGKGWSCPSDTRLSIEPDSTIRFYSSTHGTIFFESIPELEGQIVYNTISKSKLQNNNGCYTVQTNQGFTFTFRKQNSPSSEMLIESITDTCNNAITFQREENILKRVCSTDGHSIEVKSTVQGLITELLYHHPRLEKPIPLARYEYTQNTYLSIVYDQSKIPCFFEYNNGLLTKHTNRNGFSYIYEYATTFNDELKCIHSSNSENTYDYKFTYHESLQTEIQNSTGCTFLIRYTPYQQILTITDPTGCMTLCEYDLAGRCSAIIDQSGKRTEYRFDERGNCIGLRYGQSNEMVITYNSSGLPCTISDFNAHLWTFQWNEKQLLEKQINPLGGTTTYRYSANGDLISIVNAKGFETTLCYDSFGNIIAINESQSQKHSFEYDHFANIVAWTDPCFRKTGITYDQKSRVSKIVYPSNTSVAYTYDKEDFITTYTNESEQVTTFEYTRSGALKRQINPDGSELRFEYDTHGKMLSFVNEKGKKYTFTRDCLGRIKEETDFWNKTKKYSYDNIGNITSIVDEAGSSTTFTYDHLWRIISKQSSDGNQELFSYDNSGNLIRSENSMLITECEYDAADQLITQKQPQFEVQYTYDLNGNCIQRKTSFKNTLTYEYDSFDRLYKIHLNDKQILLIHRDIKSGTIIETFSDVLQRKSTYDMDNRLTHQSLILDNKVLVSRGYEYDKKGNLSKIQDPYKGSISLRYDPMGRLIKHLIPDDFVREYAYDSAGSVLRELEKKTAFIEKNSFQTSSADSKTHEKQYRKALFGSNSYVYDYSGNLVQRRRPQDITTFTWNSMNQLLKAVVKQRHHKERSETPEHLITFGYDCQSRRIFKKTELHTIHFFWQGTRLLAEKKSDLKYREYIYHPHSPDPIAVIDSGKGVLFFNIDQVGVPHELVTSKGQILWSASLGPFGSIDKCNVHYIDNPIRIHGQYYDVETDLCYTEKRYFDPQTGHYINQKPQWLDSVFEVYTEKR